MTATFSANKTIVVTLLLATVHGCAAAQQSPLFVGLAAARVAEPVKVSSVLRDLGLDSGKHCRSDIAALNVDEQAEMMAALSGGAVSLGDRSRLRRLVESEARAMIELVSGGSPGQSLADVDELNQSFSRRLQGDPEDKGSVSGGAPKNSPGA
jgi:hypothetical protein